MLRPLSIALFPAGLLCLWVSIGVAGGLLLLAAVADLLADKLDAKAAR